MLISGDVAGEGSNEPPAALCLQCISATFMRQLEKLVKYPNFQNLWLRLLHLLSFFLEGPQGFSHADLLHGNKGTSEMEALHHTVAVAKDGLAGMLRGLLEGGHFKG